MLGVGWGRESGQFTACLRGHIRAPFTIVLVLHVLGTAGEACQEVEFRVNHIMFDKSRAMGFKTDLVILAKLPSEGSGHGFSPQ